MKLWNRLIAWCNRPGLQEQLEKETHRTLLNLEIANTHIIDLRSQNKALRDALRGPEPGFVELTIRAVARDGTPISTQFRLNTRHIVDDRDEVANFLAHRCRALYIALVRQSE